MTEQKPSIGRIVHFNDGDRIRPQWCAAMITDCHSDTCVNLAVWGDKPASWSGRTSVYLGEAFHNWRWPPRV